MAYVAFDRAHDKGFARGGGWPEHGIDSSELDRITGSCSSSLIKLLVNTLAEAIGLTYMSFHILNVVRHNP